MCPGIPDTYQNLPESDSGSFRYTRSRDYQTPTRHALLGSRRPPKTKLLLRFVRRKRKTSLADLVRNASRSEFTSLTPENG